MARGLTWNHCQAMLTLGESTSLVNRCRHGKQLSEAAKRAEWLWSCSGVCLTAHMTGLGRAWVQGSSLPCTTTPSEAQSPGHDKETPVWAAHSHWAVGSLQGGPMQPGHLSDTACSAADLSTSLLTLCCNGCTPQLAELGPDALCHGLVR